MVDTPTNNFPTWNPLWFRTDISAPTFKEGNLEATPADGSSSPCMSTIGGLQSGKWYFEFYVKAIRSDLLFMLVGIVESALGMKAFEGDATVTSRTYRSTGVKQTNGTNSAYGATYDVGDIIGVALNITDGELTFYKNNATQGVAFTDIASAMPTGGWSFCTEAATTTNTSIANFGQDSSFAGNTTAQGNQDSNSKGDFYYAPPTDFLALCTDNLSAPEIASCRVSILIRFFIQVMIRQGSITGVGFDPDFLWVKERSSTSNHMLFDVQRGVVSNRYRLNSNTTVAEITSDPNVTLITDGFTVSSSDGGMNQDTQTYAAWNWKAGGAAVSNGDGDITSSVSANTTAGFSIVSWTGSGTLADTVGHGLSVAPSLFIIKVRDFSGENWPVWQESFGVDSNMYLDGTGALNDGNQPDRFPTLPTASVFTPGNAANIGGTGRAYIAYCFHSVEGYSKVGSYTGNGNADGPFIYTGLKPAVVITKCISTTGDWVIQDNKRNPYNAVDDRLLPNSSAAGDTTANWMDWLSNGFKPRVSDGKHNGSGSTYLYIAFAESPFKYSNAR